MGYLGTLIVLFGTLIGLAGLINGSIKKLRITGKKQISLLTLACFAIFIFITGCADTGADVSTAANDLAQEQVSETQTTEPQDNNTVSDTLEVHFIDVGQADSILIKAPSGESMLIDAGNNEDSNLVTSYIKDQGIEKLDVVVGTHPHEDHIGGLDAVINTFDIGNIYMPKVAHTTQTYEDVLLAIKNKGLKITEPTIGTTFNIGEAKCTILAPNSSNYDDLNNYSIVIKMEYGQTSFLFAGDAEEISEKEMLNKVFDLSADVLKVGHHGSSSSTSQQFLNAVNPKYAVIMVGTNNDYGHPHKETMEKLEAKNIAVYRTDECGTIVASTDGTNVKFNTQPGSYESRGSGSISSNKDGSSSSKASTTTSSSNSSSKSTDSSNSSKATSSNSGGTSSKAVTTTKKSTSDRTVYWTPKGKSYHFTKDCPTLARSKTILSGPLYSCPKNDPCDVCTY